MAAVFDLSSDEPLLVGTIRVTAEAGEEWCICDGVEPWTTGLPTPELEAAAQISRIRGMAEARMHAERAPEDVGVIQGPSGQKIMSVRINDHCEHDESHHQRRPCGHFYCERCDGYVCPRTRVALRSPGPIITCNRRPRPFEEYEYLFGENLAGSGNLTKWMNSVLNPIKMKGWPASKKKVRASRDLKGDKLFGTVTYDLSDRKVFLMLKKEIKKPI